MTPKVLAHIHGAAFTADRSWTAEEFAALLESPHVRLYAADHGFALTRTVAGESELLTVAVDPDHQRQGSARYLLERWLGDIRQKADNAFLEVAADNPGAISLYRQLGFREVSRRPAYYRRADAPAVDAVIMARPS